MNICDTNTFTYNSYMRYDNVDGEVKSIHA